MTSYSMVDADQAIKIFWSFFLTVMAVLSLIPVPGFKLAPQVVLQNPLLPIYEPYKQHGCPFSPFQTFRHSFGTVSNALILIGGVLAMNCSAFNPAQQKYIFNVTSILSILGLVLHTQMWYARDVKQFQLVPSSGVLICTIGQLVYSFFFLKFIASVFETFESIISAPLGREALFFIFAGYALVVLIILIRLVFLVIAQFSPSVFEKIYLEPQGRGKKKDT